MKASGGFEPFALSWKPTHPQHRSLSAAWINGNAEFDATYGVASKLGELAEIGQEIAWIF